MTSIMKKEIFEEPGVVKNLIQNYVTPNDKINIDLPQKVDNIVIVASGSSYNCAAIAAPLFIEYANIPCECEYSSEFILQKNILLLLTRSTFLYHNPEKHPTH